MSGRPTIKSIEPYIYVLYMLVLYDNISIERAIKMLTEVKNFYNENREYTSHSDYITSIVAGHLKAFWNAQGDHGYKQLSGWQEVFGFMEKYHPSKHRWGRLKAWITG